MYKITIKTYFSAAHFLRGYKGKCESLHGHNWNVEVVIQNSALNSLGMVMDFGDLKRITKEKLKIFDHANLNDLEYFSASCGRNPSSEEIAKYLFIELKEKVEETGCVLGEVRVWEIDSSCATYIE